MEKLKSLGVKDSKQISPAQRRHLKDEIEKLAKVIIIKRLEPWEIDEKRGDGANLNLQETLKFVEIINEAFKQNNIDRVVIDSPDPKANRLQRLISNLVKRENLEIIAEHYADSKYVECSAASIIAKVTRDAEIEVLKKEYGDFGSGYPSDPKCVKWLNNYLNMHDDLPKIVRHSWDTIKQMLKNRSQKDLKKFLGKS